MTQHTFEPGDIVTFNEPPNYVGLHVADGAPGVVRETGLHWNGASNAVRVETTLPGHDYNQTLTFFPANLRPVRVTADHIGKWARGFTTGDDHREGPRRGRITGFTTNTIGTTNGAIFRDTAVLVVGPVDDPAPQPVREVQPTQQAPNPLTEEKSGWIGSGESFASATDTTRTVFSDATRSSASCADESSTTTTDVFELGDGSGSFVWRDGVPKRKRLLDENPPWDIATHEPRLVARGPSLDAVAVFVRPEDAARAVVAVNEANGLRDEVNRLQDMLVASDNRTCDARDEADALRAELVEVQDVAERANGKRIQAEAEKARAERRLSDARVKTHTARESGNRAVAEIDALLVEARAERDRLAAQLAEAQDTDRGLPHVEVRREERGLRAYIDGQSWAALPPEADTNVLRKVVAAHIALLAARERVAAQEDAPTVNDDVDADVALVCRSVQEHGFGSIEAANAFDRIAAAARRAGQEDKR